jgi:retinal rod rhodopsin-sensitive cGMP 3',5'-cyclic phosphodiesterase subunit delta
VIPNSNNNSWENIIDAADPEEMLPAEMLSGNTVIETTFFDGDKIIGTSRFRVFYT